MTGKGLLSTFWYRVLRGGRTIHYGVTAYSPEDAVQLLEGEGFGFAPGDRVAVTADIRIEQLDQRHIVPNMGPMQIRGVWYPQRNLR